MTTGFTAATPVGGPRRPCVKLRIARPSGAGDLLHDGILDIVRSRSRSCFHPFYNLLQREPFGRDVRFRNWGIGFAQVPEERGSRAFVETLARRVRVVFECGDGAGQKRAIITHAAHHSPITYSAPTWTPSPHQQ